MSNDQFFSFNIGSTENVFNAKELTVFATTTHTYTHNALTHFLPGKHFLEQQQHVIFSKKKKEMHLFLIQNSIKQVTH